ncbi:winged helix DNA-binding domain-containing protein [Paractinoplanes globisporus]|uniref:Winged helix DNA-binding domain-containing protein n=1 Tax=Paractinoplanes globisporus TaxID=113565 RepID=A0ABW6WLQ6_9ACTN|nr:winged helix DNA-binding domain-containing protein [Actinoplanes globisporus]
MTTLSTRALNRATLARQHLLSRAEIDPLAAIEHLGGMQAQAPLAPYVGLWTRLLHFVPEELSKLIEERRAVRTHLMRATVHLVSARDCLDWHAHFRGRHTAAIAPLIRGLSADPAEVGAQARRLLAEKPLVRSELGRLLAERWPDDDPSALAFAAAREVPTCQVPPRGLWGRTGPAAWAPVETWLGEPLRTTPLDGLVLRALGAFGPASVADLQMWSGLTRLAEVVARLPLVTFRSETGQILYDLPGAPRPDEDVPAPPRFLPEYDNLLLAHRDRGRFNPHGRPVPLPPGNGATTGTFLVDGRWEGTWELREKKLRLRAYAPIELDALVAEAAALTSFLAPDAEVVVEAD